MNLDRHRASGRASGTVRVRRGIVFLFGITCIVGATPASLFLLLLAVDMIRSDRDNASTDFGFQPIDALQPLALALCFAALAVVGIRFSARALDRSMLSPRQWRRFRQAFGLVLVASSLLTMIHALAPEVALIFMAGTGALLVATSMRTPPALAAVAFTLGGTIIYDLVVGMAREAPASNGLLRLAAAVARHGTFQATHDVQVAGAVIAIVAMGRMLSDHRHAILVEGLVKRTGAASTVRASGMLETWRFHRAIAAISAAVGLAVAGWALVHAYATRACPFCPVLLF
jgi:hypothetical protein